MNTLYDLLDSYADDAPDLAPSTVRKLKHHINRFEKHTDYGAVDKIQMNTFFAFRRSCLQADLSPFTIEGTINDIMLLLRHALAMGVVNNLPEVGRRLMRRMGFPLQPTIEEFGKLYSAIDKAECRWPNLPGVDNAAFWKIWLTTAYFTALRHVDLMRNLLWPNVSDGMITVLVAKTGLHHEFPCHPILWKHLLRMPRFGDEPRVFPVGKTPHLVLRELRRISDAAGLEKAITPQQIRRLSATEYGKAGGPGCGSLITGHSMPKRHDAFYMHALSLLQVASDKLCVPKCMTKE